MMGCVSAKVDSDESHVVPTPTAKMYYSHYNQLEECHFPHTAGSMDVAYNMNVV